MESSKSNGRSSAVRHRRFTSEAYGYRTNSGAAAALVVERARRVDGDRLARKLNTRSWRLIMKRALDCLGAILLLLLLSPVMAAAALGVKLSSPGPVLFRQQRAGLGDRTFVLLKFRSMHGSFAMGHEPGRTDASAPGTLMKSRTDPRVTAFGKWLRATSIDELPQLWNVIRGDMSLVGPRPLLPFMLESDPLLRRLRGLVRPGITGLWQLRDRANNTTAAAMLPHDLDYLENFSLRQDAMILLRTVPAVLSCRGAF